MSKLQKIALFNLCIAGFDLIIQLLRLFASDIGIRLVISVITLILSCILVVSYFHRRKLAKLGSSQYDERDKSIHTKAALIGLMVSFLVFFLSTIIAFLSFGPGGAVDIGLILGIFLLVAMSFFTVESAMVLILYNLGIKGEIS